MLELYEFLRSYVAGRGHGGVAVAGAGEVQPDLESLVGLATKTVATKSFAASVGNLNKDVRLTVVDGRGQSEVWQEVAKLNAKTGADYESGSFTANFGQQHVAAKTDPYIAGFHNTLLEQPQVVGVVVAVNGQVQSVDIFESTPLFEKLWPKLLKGFALDALSQSGDSAAEATRCDIAACIEFLSAAEQPQVSKTEIDSNLTVRRRESESVISFSATDAANDNMSGMGGGFGGAVHAGAFSK